MLSQFVFIYLDDILMYTRSSRDCVVHVRQVLCQLQENQLFIKAEKCCFHASTIPFLGFIVFTGNIQMDP